MDKSGRSGQGEKGLGAELLSRCKVVTTKGDYCFTGKYLREREKANWHYYQTVEGDILHFRKEHMIVVIEHLPGEEDAKRQSEFE